MIDVLAQLPAHPPVMLAVAAAVVVVARARTPRRDPQRWFDAAQRAHARTRAGGQCEYTRWGRRCSHRAEEIDHYVPHARGGATTLTHAVAACREHNQAKGARLLPWWQTKALQRRRRTYFPPGEALRPGQRYRIGVVR